MEQDGTYSINLEARLGLSENESAIDAIEAGLVAWHQDNPCGIKPSNTVCESNTTSPSSPTNLNPDNDPDPGQGNPTVQNTSGSIATFLACPLFLLVLALIAL